MPQNKDLDSIKLPMELCFGQPPETKFKNNLESIKVKLINAPTIFDLLNFIPQFVNATWETDPSNSKLNLVECSQLLYDAFNGKALPTALETIRLTFLIEGISLQEVTHILRYRTASFSADCSGDKWWHKKDALVPSSVQQSNGHECVRGGSRSIYERYQKIVEDAKQLYCDMIDTKQISIMDARYILPRCLETFYYMSISLKDAIHFIKQRIDKQIQPETDNVIAYKMWIELLKQYSPLIDKVIDIHSPSWFYVNMARTGKATNLYFPDADSDKFEWNENDFIYQCTRDKMNGTDEGATNKFNEIAKKLEEQMAYEKRLSAKYYYEALGEHYCGEAETEDDYASDSRQ